MERGGQGIPHQGVARDEGTHDGSVHCAVERGTGGNAPMTDAMKGYSSAMTTMTIDEARMLLWSRVPSGESWGAHSETVARTAGTLADALAAAGEAVNPALARAGGLLHDIGRSITHHGTGHCWEGYQLLRGMGQPVLAQFCLAHSYGGMTPEEAVRVGWPDADYRPRTWEEKVVTIADGLTHFARVVFLDERVASVLERYRHSAGTPDYALLADIVTKNRALIAEVEAVIGQLVEPLVGAQHLEVAGVTCEG